MHELRKVGAKGLLVGIRRAEGENGGGGREGGEGRAEGGNGGGGGRE